MKINSTLLALGLGLASASLASAQNYVYMSGSTAARSAVYATLASSGGVFDSPGPTNIITQGSGTASGATYMSFYGNIGGSAYVIKCSWSGSEGGIADLANNPSQTESFLQDSATTSSSSPGPFVSAPVDLAMADNAVTYSQHPTAAITGTKVCVIPFELIKEVGSASDLNNVTDAQFRQAITGGAPLVLFTGNTNDTNFVYITGRDNNSGTRVNTLGETGYGIFTAAYQVELNSSGQMTTDNNPSSPNFGLYLWGPYDGYSGGGSVATQMGVNCSSTVDQINGGTGISVIGYVGISDGNTALGLGATQIPFNGVLESAASVIAGQYDLWGNEYCYHLNSPSSGALTVYGKLTGSGGITHYSNGTSTIDLNLMHATRKGPTTDPVSTL